MVMGSIFDTPTDEEDQNPPQPQQPPPQDPLAQQPTQDQIDSLNHAQGIVQQGLQTVTNMFGPQAQQTADQNSINQAQSLVGGALQGVNTVAQAGAPTPAVQGQDYIDAPTNSLRAQLEQGRQGQSQYGYAGQALATALPMVAFGAPAAAAGLGIQAATQAAGLPQPVQDAASLLPFTEGGLVQRGLQAGLGGLGAYGGQQADQALNLPQIPGLGGPLTLAGGIGGMGAAGLFDRGPRPETPTAQPEPAQNFTNAPSSTTTTSGAQPNEPEFRSDFNIQPEQLSGLAKSIADHQKVISDMAVNAGITEDQARQMLANADMSSIRTRGASAREDYEETIGNLMRQDGLTREQAERVYMRPASFENGTNGPTGTTNTTGAYPPADQFASPEHQQGYYQGLLDTTQLAPHEFRPTRGPDDTDFNQGYKEARANLPPGSLVNAPYPGPPGEPPLNLAGQINAGMDPRTPEQIAASNAAGSDAFGNLRSASPEAQAFQQSPAGQQFNGQRTTGAQAGEASAPINNNGGRGGYGGNGPPPALAGKIDWDPFHNLMSAIGAPTQPLLTGLHLARFAPQEALRPSVLGNGLRAMGEAALKGNADAVSAHINNDFGPNVPTNLRPEAMKAQSGNPPTSPTAVQKMINSVPVVGPILNRFREVNSALLGNLRDAHYLTTADRLARTDPNASPEMYNDLWREANNATGHSTIPGLSGNSVIGNMGLGPSAMAARVQELGNTVIGSGAPVPFAAAGSRAEAFKTLMGVAGTMAGTTALASALGANVNTTNPFTAFGVDSTFLKPVTTNGVFKTAYGTGGAGYDTVIKAAANIGNDLFNGDEKAALNHALAFSRGEFGVVPSGVIDAILGTTWDGKPYSWNDFLNEAKTGFMADQNGNLGQGRSVPIPAQDMGEAFRAYGPEGLLRAAPSLLASSVQTSPINTTSQAFKYATTPETLTRAFQGEDKPLATILQGKDWNDLMSTEKSALTKTLDPQVLQQIHDESYQRNPETTKHSDTVQYIADKKTAVENEILDRYNRGELDGAHAANLMKAAQRDYYSIKDKLDSDPAYQAEQKKFASNPQSGAQVALDGYYQIQDKQARQDYLAHIMQADPELGSRLMIATQPHNQSKLEEMYYAGQLK